MAHSRLDSGHGDREAVREVSSTTRNPLGHCPVLAGLWPLFARHHYLSGTLSPAAECYVAIWNGTPVAFCGVLPLMGMKGRRRISRIVTLPDFQGVGIGSAFLDGMGLIYRKRGLRLNITASHPSVIGHCRRSPKWKTVNVRKTGSGTRQFNKPCRGSAGRAVVSFEYLGSG